MKTLITLILFTLFCSTGFTQILLDENFNYPENDSIAANGWLTHSISNPSNAIYVSSPGLTYPGYPLTTGNRAVMRNFGSDNNRTFTPVTSGSVYVSMLVNIDTARTGDYFLHLSKSPINTTFFNARLFVKKNVAGPNLAFGIRKGSSDIIMYSDSIYFTGITYLLVLKYKTVAGATNDSVSLYINPTPANVEPVVPTVGPYCPAAIADCDTLGSVALRQGSTTSAANLSIDGIRVSTFWPMLTEIHTISETPEQFSLNQNYPNPFNPSTNIQFSVPKSSFVNITLFDVLGKKITDIVNENITAGRHSVSFDGTGLASGVYFYTITASSGVEKFVETKAMVLSK